MLKELTELKPIIPSLEEAKAYIAALDLKRIFKKMEKDGWTHESVLEICEQYRHFLYLVKKYGRQYGPFSPTYEIDMFWHHHILDTENYTKDCYAIFGRYLHHDPYDTRITLENKKNVFEKLQQLHFEEFGDYIYEVKKSKLKQIKMILLN